MRKFIIPWLAVFLSCAPAKNIVKSESTQSVDEQTIKQNNARFDESFDPNKLNEEPWVIKKRSFRRTENIKANRDSAGSRFESAKIRESLVFGFRIQLFSTTDYFLALAIRDEASGKLNEDIYVDYEQPYYKVRAGNFTDREKAEELKELAKSEGYSEAWVIRTNVLLKEK